MCHKADSVLSKFDFPQPQPCINSRAKSAPMQPSHSIQFNLLRPVFEASLH
jgi:hypothetical protein